MARRASKPVKLAEWQIKIAKVARHIGTVRAADAEAANRAGNREI